MTMYNSLTNDSYKHGHFLQYAPEACVISAYIEARLNGFSDEVLFAGLQPYLIEYLSKPITLADLDEIELICRMHGDPFNREGWLRIVNEFGGYLPLEIKALPEGMIVPCGVPLVQLENTVDDMEWLTTFVETHLLRAIWYMSTVATLSWKVKKVIRRGLEITSDDVEGQLPFKLHDFGDRGATSGESAGLGGLAHLINFMGGDTLEAIIAGRRYYGIEMAGFSIPAAEHSTMTSWGRDREVDAYENMLDAFDGEGKIVAVVSDSYDLDNAVENIWGGVLREKVLTRKGSLVIRPDSGDPVETPIRVVKKLWSIFGGTINSKGYRVLNPKVRVIQGDGMTIDTIALLVDRMIEEGFAIDNIAFGMGGGLLQLVNRDMLRFAMKANAMKTKSGEWIDISKNPLTDPTKGSKAGRQAVVRRNGKLVAVRLDSIDPEEDLLEVVWRNGELLRWMSFEQVRANSNA